jgi:penicillin-binding protein 1A
MATAYGTLAADGERHDPYYIDRIEDRHGKTIFQAALKGERAVPAELARAETQVLEQVVQRGTGRSAAVPGWNVAGKTGTAEEFGDAWFVGYTPKLATAVWMGNPETNQDRMYDVGGIRVYGGTYPARIVGAFMKDALAGEAPVDFPPPSRSIYSGGQYLRAPGGLGPPSSRLAGNGSQSGSESASGANGANDSPPTPSLPPVAAVKPLSPPRLRIPPPATIDVRSRIPLLPTPTLPPRPVITRPSRATTPPPPTARRRRF